MSVLLDKLAEARSEHRRVCHSENPHYRPGSTAEKAARDEYIIRLLERIVDLLDRPL